MRSCTVVSSVKHPSLPPGCEEFLLHRSLRQGQPHPDVPVVGFLGKGKLTSNIELATWVGDFC